MNRLESRIGKLEATIGSASQDGDYDNWLDYDDHVSYLCNEDGKDVLCVHLLAKGNQYQFNTERDLWNAFPPGTKFRRSGGGNFVIVDGVVVRELNFPPSDGKLSPETQAALDLVFAM
jgi:hypothetical protein